MNDAEIYAALSASRYFDARWYLAHYADVKESGEDPLRHYINGGAAEGRRPGPLFEPEWYAERYGSPAARGGAGLLLDLVLKPHSELRYGSWRDLLISKIAGSTEQVERLIRRYRDMNVTRPATGLALQWPLLHRRWCDYYLHRGARAEADGDLALAMENYRKAIQISGDTADAHLLHASVFRRLQLWEFEAFESMYKGVSLLVAHVSCYPRERDAHASADSFADDGDAGTGHLIVVADDSRARFEFFPERRLLVVPAGDEYERLPMKMQALLTFLGHAKLEIDVLKVDDDVHCRDIRALRRDLATVLDSCSYGGGSIVPVRPFTGSTFWHLGKCRSPEKNDEPDTLINHAPYVEGKYYWLGSGTVNALSKLTVAHDKIFSREIYEDRAVGVILDHYGFPPTKLDLIASGSLRRVGAHREAGSRNA
jgi:hypothetical protein